MRYLKPQSQPEIGRTFDLKRLGAGQFTAAPLVCLTLFLFNLAIWGKFDVLYMVELLHQLPLCIALFDRQLSFAFIVFSCIQIETKEK